jgi:imidazolonepropionase-like amidohydrolase
MRTAPTAINVALAAGADSIEHGTMPDDETLQLFKQSGAFYVPTLSTVNGYLERSPQDPNAYPPDGARKGALAARDHRQGAEKRPCRPA